MTMLLKLDSIPCLIAAGVRARVRDRVAAMPGWRRGVILCLLAVVGCGDQGVPVPAPPVAVECGEHLSLCGGHCVDTIFDQNHCGGCDSPCGQEKGCFAGACSSPESMSRPRGGCAVAVGPDGWIYVMGGGLTNGGNPPWDSVEAYDPRKNRWFPKPHLLGTRLYAAAIGPVDGKIFLTGGVVHSDGEYPLPEVATFDLEKWEPVASLLEPRDDHAIAIGGDGRIRVTSGNQATEYATTTEVLRDGVWVEEGTTPFVGWGARGASSPKDGRIYLTGGNPKQGLSLSRQRWAFVFDPASPEPKWERLPDMNQGRFVHGAAFGPDRMLYVVGGFIDKGVGFEGLASVERFDPATRTWSDAPPLPDVRTDTSAVVVGRRLYLPGGAGNAPGSAYADLFVYDFDTGRWYP